MLKKLFALGLLAVQLPVCSPSNIRWSASNNRVYITGGVACSLSDIKTMGSKYIPLTSDSSAPNTWFLGANIVLQNGSALILHDGELRMKSDPVSYISIIANNGDIDIQNEKITSWDKTKNAPDANYADGRAFISAKSFLDSYGKPQESRIDIDSSEIGYLGFNTAESYGLSWKVLGVTTATNSIFDKVGVYGNITNSKIHNNYFGIYTFGSQNMNFINNEVFGNVEYGLDFHDDSDYLIVKNNDVSKNGWHGIITSKRCDHANISDNNSSDNAGVGIMLHKSATDTLVVSNVTNRNKDSGIAIFDSYKNQIWGNISNLNGKGIRLSVGSHDNLIEYNDFSNNLNSGIYTYKGNDVSVSGDGRVRFNIFKGNTVNYNKSYGIKITQQSYQNIFLQNYIQNNPVGICLSDSKDNTFTGNILSGNGVNYCN